MSTQATGWQSALDALNPHLLTISLRLRSEKPAVDESTGAAVRFPFFHHTILHSLMKEVVRNTARGPADDFASGTASIPPGLVPCAAESGRVSFTSGEIYRLGVSIVPRLSPSAAEIASALQKLGSNPSRAADGVQLAGNFDLALIEPLPGITAEELGRQFEWLRKQKSVSIRFLSPFHGKVPGRRTYIVANDFTLPGWLNAIHWRVFSLIHGRRPDQSNPAESPPAIAGMGLGNCELFDVAIPKRYPKPGELPYELPGIIGRFAVFGVSDEWLFWLLLGQYLHAGEGTGWGLGRYRVESPEFHERFLRNYSLLSRVAETACLETAARRADAVPGLDSPLPPEDGIPPGPIRSLAQSVAEGSYLPAPLNGFEVTHRGKVRAIAVANRADRILQRATVDVLEPICESLFKQCSFGYRHGRSRRDAAGLISQAWNEGYRYALDADIEAFFDHVRWDRLFAKLDALFPDEPLIPLIRRWISADVLYRGNVIHRSQGLPLGLSISPLLANLYLDDLDDELGLQGFRLVRYADDFVVLTRNMETAERARCEAAAVLERIGLRLNEGKTRVVRLEDGFTYLGYLFCRSMVLEPGPSLSPVAPEKVASVVKSAWTSQLNTKQVRRLTPHGDLRRIGPANLPAPDKAPALPSVAPSAEAVVAVPDSPHGPDRAELTSPEPATTSAPPDKRVPAPVAPPQQRWGLYVVGRETGISIHYNSLSILRDGEQPAPIPVEKVSHVVSIGSGRISSPVLMALGERGIPVFFCRRSGELTGVFHPHGPARATGDYQLWLAQSAAAGDPARRLAFGRAVVAAKLARQAETLTLFATADQRVRATQIRQLAACVPAAPGIDALMGLEGSASRILFDGIQHQLLGLTRDWPFLHRERRPPPDPVNALLSFGYTLLYIHAATALWTAGLLPQIGLFHTARPGHLALASDLVEEFRHTVDRLVVRLINRREVRAEHFLHGPESDAGACRLSDDGRRVFILALDGVLQGHELNDPSLPQGAQSPLRAMERQALRIANFLAGTIPAYSPLEED